MEFLNLTQGNRTVDEYESRFTSLGRYDPDSIKSEAIRVRRFVDGLRPSIRAKLAPFDVATYREAVRRAQLCEQDYDLQIFEFSWGKDKGPRKLGDGKSAKLGRKFMSKRRREVDEFQKRAARPFMPPTQTLARGIVIGGPRSTTDQCRLCGRYHGGRPCHLQGTRCFRCGKFGHYARECPKIVEAVPQRGREPERVPTVAPPARKKALAEEKGKQVVGQGRVYAIHQASADTSSEVIKGTILIFNLEVIALFDSGATHSFISPACASKLKGFVEPTYLSRTLLISTPMRVSQLVEQVNKDCKVRVGDKCMTANLILLNMYDIDVILGMDWLAANHAIIDCNSKSIKFSLPEECVVRF